MDRRLLFPAVVATAWAQQTSPATAEAEKALRARAEEFFKLEMSKSFRKAEALVAADSKDYYYDHHTQELKDIRIDSVEFSEGGKQAKVRTTVTKILSAPMIGSQEFKVPSTSDWKLEDGQWVWFHIPTDYVDTPFGKMKINKEGGVSSPPPGMPADTSNLQSLVTIDRTTISLSAGRTDTVTITNHLPGAITIAIGDHPEGLTVSADKTQLNREEKAVVSLSVSGNTKPNGTLTIKAEPLQEFIIQVNTK